METREIILAMRRGRQQELAAAKNGVEALRIAQSVQTGEVSYRDSKRGAISFSHL